MYKYLVNVQQRFNSTQVERKWHPLKKAYAFPWVTE